jgi:hypothetical protein
LALVTRRLKRRDEKKAVELPPINRPTHAIELKEGATLL